MLALDAKAVPRYYRVRMLTAEGQLHSDETSQGQVLAMLEESVPEFKAKMKAWAQQEYGQDLTFEVFPA